MLDTHVVSEVLLGFARKNGDQYAFILRLMVLINKYTSTKTIEFMKRPHLDNDTGRAYCALVGACEWCGGAFGAQTTKCTATLCDLTSGECIWGMNFCNPCLEKNVVKMERSDLSQPPKQFGPSRFDQRIFDRRLGLPGTDDLHRRINHTFFVTFLLSERGERPAITKRARAHDMRAFVDSFGPHLDAHDARMRERALMDTDSVEESEEDGFDEIVFEH